MNDAAETAQQQTEVSNPHIIGSRLIDIVDTANRWLQNGILETEADVSRLLKIRALYKKAAEHLAVIKLALTLEPFLCQKHSCSKDMGLYPDGWIWNRSLDEQLIRHVIDNHSSVGFNLQTVPELRSWKPDNSILISRLQRIAAYYRIHDQEHQNKVPSADDSGSAENKENQHQTFGFPIDYLSLLSELQKQFDLGTNIV